MPRVSQRPKKNHEECLLHPYSGYHLFHIFLKLTFTQCSLKKFSILFNQELIQWTQLVVYAIFYQPIQIFFLIKNLKFSTSFAARDDLVTWMQLMKCKWMTAHWNFQKPVSFPYFNKTEWCHSHFILCLSHFFLTRMQTQFIEEKLP